MFLKLYLIALPICFAIDMVWLGLIAKNFYKAQIGFMMKVNINWIAALVFYLLFIACLVFFVIEPAITKHSWVQALLVGALFGLVTYGTYDLTNLAMTKNWPLLVTIVDMAWGVFIAASVSLITYFVA